MADRATLEIIEAGADEHAAVRFWRAFSGERGRFDHIDILKETHKTAVYRLHPVSPGSPTVIAKRRLHDAIAHELMIYEQVLSTLPVSSLACYGSLAGDADTSWIFLEDSGGIELSYKSEAHRAAATRWLACAHVATSARPELSALDDRGARHYLGHLRDARQTLGRHVHNPALDPGEVVLLRRMLSLLDCVEEHWPGVEAFSATLPQTFTHGDFVQKNVHVRDVRGDLTVLPLDWETSGWSVPAADLPRVDIEQYWAMVRHAWPDLQLDDARRMASLGAVFRLLAAISWEAPSFRASWVKRAAIKMALYNERLAAAMDVWGSR